MMASLSTVSSDELLAALQLQYDWGVDAVVEDEVWQPLAPEPQKLVQTPPRAVSSSSVRHETAFSQHEALLSARDLPELLRLSEHIEGVTLSRTAMNRLVPRYAPNAAFMVVGEVPDADEDRSGRLFAGKAGELLDAVLASVGLNRDQLSFVPTIPWRPPGGQRVPDRELKACLPLLQRSITLGQPSHIVTMGATPMRLLLKTNDRLSQVRGRWAEATLPGMAQPIPVFPMLHPLQLTGAPLLRRHFWRDLLVLTDSLGCAGEGKEHK
ncbi:MULTISPECIES: uracil-DNA glycosylase [unclassified Saccharibacter]|uniref:uracil-DNA glycosylase n=1 Tax=unclassified Saccharibacter TaxID=2648722 RepID=UPI001EF01EF4|nr:MULTISPECIES: uracil-DNA glycosylase [unclassified Saccharibacter]